MNRVISLQVVLHITIAVTVLPGRPITAADPPTKIDLPRPKERQFVLDIADMITSADEKRIQTICDKLLTDKATPIVVLTIESMAKHGARKMRIETFAMSVFKQWGIGQAKIHGHKWDTGILLVVSKNDRKARIELGAGWKHDKDKLCQQIMDQQIIRNFKKGKFSQGILAGVCELEKMARTLQIPKAHQR